MLSQIFRGTDTFNPQHEPSQILDLDVNGLYSSTMREALPVSDFEWMTKGEIACLNIGAVPDDAPTGYILECHGYEHKATVCTRRQRFKQCGEAHLNSEQCREKYCLNCRTAELPDTRPWKSDASPERKGTNDYAREPLPAEWWRHHREKDLQVE
ncbi:hypothetical protein HPB47_013813 [Ixodes persulcatus]|uniref:Uncharacterized protein n=1 Tax=Ixodes persulcatus TaxID=34615 RepID=A0AC60QXS7_IXOPE|nr:hypothetical protein HPB47_013813 [Ixodes persulcatus]